MLTSRGFVEKQELRVVVDTETFSALLSINNSKAKAILTCAAEYPCIRLLRTPGETDHRILEVIPPFSEKLDSEGNIQAIEVEDNATHRSAAFGYRMRDIDSVARHLAGKAEVSAAQKRQVILAFVHACLTSVGWVHLLVTDKEILLRNRVFLESRYPGSSLADGRLSIATVDEAGEIFDLFLKSRNIYHIPGPSENTAWYHYWLSFRSQVPYYHVGDPILDALAKRFTFILMCLDRIGCEHYSKPSNSAMASTEYHFYYLLSLITGVLDSLAIRTDSQFILGFRTRPHKVSLDPNPGKDFLKAIRDGSPPLPDLRKHIEQHVYYIKLVYALRHEVIHREMLPPVAFHVENRSESWEMNLIGPMETEIVQLVRQCGDRPDPFGSFSIWGLYELPHQPDAHYYLLPLRFGQTAVQALIAFVNGYLQLLGFSDFIEESRAEDVHGGFLESLKLFTELKFGF